VAALPHPLSELWSTLPDLRAEAEGAPGSPLRALHAAALAFSQETDGGGGAEESTLDPVAQRLENLRHIEGCMCAAAALGSAHEYSTWAQSYALALVSTRDERRARELCEGLIALAAGGADGAVAARKLLAQSVLPALATNRSLQRVVEQYSAALRDMD